jgi:Ca-activated chloride channel family protein
MVFALAKPFLYDSLGNNVKKGRDLVLAIDASGSMAQSGFSAMQRFKNRYDINIELSKDFTKNRLDDNIGAVIFGTFAYTASPLSYDLESLRFLLEMTTVGIAGESTAIGDAIVQSLLTLSFGDAKSKVIILLTDGYHNAGQYSPKEAVAKAKKEGIKIYTIGIGKKSDYDLLMLNQIAKESGGVSYSASSAEELSKIYKQIDELEPSPIRGERYLNQKLLIFYPLFLLFILLFLWVLHERRSEV